jgi:hypothetical protein
MGGVECRRGPRRFRGREIPIVADSRYKITGAFPRIVGFWLMFPLFFSAVLNLASLEPTEWGRPCLLV